MLLIRLSAPTAFLLVCLASYFLDTYRRTACKHLSAPGGALRFLLAFPPCSYTKPCDLSHIDSKGQSAAASQVFRK